MTVERGTGQHGWASIAPAWPLLGRDAELLRVAAALASSIVGGVVIEGAAGLGKTRLAREALALAARGGLPTRHVLASESAARIPLGALSSLIADLPPGQWGRAELLAHVRAAVVALGGAQRLVLSVDDAHRLDPLSAELVADLARTREVFLVATRRTDVAPPAVIEQLVAEGLVELIEMRPLEPHSVSDLLRHVLGGAIEAGTTQEFVRACGGNPLFLRELVHAAREQGLLTRDAGLWRLVAPLAVSSRLGEIMRNRVGTLQPDERGALEVIAYGEPLGLGELEAKYGAFVLDALRRRELIDVGRAQRRAQVTLAHPLYGEVVRSTVGPIQVRAIYGELADMLASSGAHRGDDILRSGIFQVEAGREGDHGLLLAAAEEARRRWDLALAERLAEAAWRAGGGFRAGLVVAQVQLLLGRADKAERSLVSLQQHVTSDAERVALASARIDTLAVGLGQQDEALLYAAAVEAELVDPESRYAIAGKRAMLLYLAGKSDVATEVLKPVLEHGSLRQVAEVASVASMCLAFSGRLTAAVDIATRGRAAYEAHDGLPLTFGVHMIDVSKGVALGHAGRLREAEALARSGYEQALHDRSPEARALFCELRSWVSRLMGLPATAALFAAEAETIYRQLGWAPFLRFALANRAHALALLGAVDEAQSVVADLDALGIPATDVSGSLIGQARAWVALARGDLDDGREMLEQARDVAYATGDRVGEVAVLHDLARVGAAALVVDRLTELTGIVEGELVRASATHATGLATGDATVLEHASMQFASLGARLFAAEALARAAVVWRRAGDIRRAVALEQRLAAAVGECEGAITPALTAVRAQAVLTPQELKVVGLAAAGLANRDIAANLGVSVRTVETQLQRAYDKLGVHRRGDLPGALAL